MRKYALLFLLFIVTISFSADENKRVLVRNFKSNSIDSTELTSLTNIFANELRNYSNYTVISFEEATSLADQYGTTVMFDRDNDEDLQKIADAVDAPYIVSGDINFVGSRYVSTIALINVNSAMTERTVSEIVPTIDSIVDIMPKMAEEIVGESVKNSGSTVKNDTETSERIDRIGDFFIDIAVGVRDKSRELVDAVSEDDDDKK